MTTLMSYGDEIAEEACPICEQQRCSLAHVYHRLVAPAVNFGAMVMARTCLWSALTLLLAIAAGWITP